MEDGSTISENGNTTIVTSFNSETSEVASLTVSGTWTVIKDGDTYAIEGSMTTVGNCQYWTSGLITLNKNGLEADVDFGEDTCDNIATLIYPNNVTQEITL